MTKKRRMAVVAVLLGNTMVMTETKAEEPVLSIETDRAVAMAGTLLPASLPVRAPEPDDKVSELRIDEVVMMLTLVGE